MKKISCILVCALFLAACNNNSSESKAVTTDTVNTAPVNEMSNPNHTPGSNAPGEATANGRYHLL